MTERGLKNINVFYSTFTNIFYLFLSRFYVFNVFYFYWNAFFTSMAGGALAVWAVTKMNLLNNNMPLSVADPQLLKGGRKGHEGVGYGEGLRILKFCFWNCAFYCILNSNPTYASITFITACNECGKQSPKQSVYDVLSPDLLTLYVYTHKNPATKNYTEL